MKKIISAICAATFLLTLAGCGKKDTLQVTEDSSQIILDTPIIAVDDPEELELQKISELRGDIDRQVESIKSADYKNLTVLDNFTVSLPETDVLYELELTRPEYTWEECYEHFDRVFDANFGGIYSEEDKALIYYALASEDVWNDHSGYPKILLAERREKFEGGELHLKSMHVETDKACVEMSPYQIGLGIFRLYHDGIKNRAPFDDDPKYYPSLSNFHAERWFKTVKETFDVDCDDRYELLNGEISVNEAADWITQIVKEGGYTWGGDLEPRIYEYRVFDLNEGKYGLEFEFAPYYKGVTLDCGAVTYSDYSTGMPVDEYKLSHEYYLQPARALIIESGELESFSDGDSAYNVAELAEYDSVIPLDKVVEIAAEKFSEEMRMSLGSADLLYSKTYPKDGQQAVKGAFPVWKLRLKNARDGWVYITYINAVTGEMEYYLTKNWVL